MAHSFPFVSDITDIAVQPWVTTAWEPHGIRMEYDSYSASIDKYEIADCTTLPEARSAGERVEQS